MVDKIHTFTTGIVGASIVQVVPNIMEHMPSSEDIANITQAIVQIVIGVGTIYKILNPNPPKKNGE